MVWSTFYCLHHCHPLSPVAEFLRQHPPGVADVAFAVEDVEAAIAQAQAHGATILQPIQEQQLGQASLKCGKIAAWGGLTHTLIEKSVVSSQWSVVSQRGEAAPVLPPCVDERLLNPEGLRLALATQECHSEGVSSQRQLTTDNQQLTTDGNFTTIDHIVLNVAIGELELAVSWYKNILDFQPQQTFKIQTDRSALHSQVMISRNGRVQLPINEPASSNSQIQEFLDVNRGAGIQHIALRTSNLKSMIAQFRARGLSLLSVPKSYYTQLKKRPGLPLSSQELEAIAQQEILADWKEDAQNAVLLQIFTQPIFEQPTFFFEFIERRSQAQGFGEGNFRALFEAIESEQIKRGSLK